MATVERLTAEVDANPAAAIAGLTAFDAAADASARDRTAHINVETDRDALRNVMGIFQEMQKTAGDAAKGVSEVLGDMTGAAEAAGAGLGGAGRSASSASGGFDMFSRSGIGLVNMIVGMAGQLVMAVAALTAIYSAATVAVGALHMLTAAAAGVYGALAPLVGLLGAVPVGLGAISGGIGAVILGFQGVGKAMSAMDTATNASTRSTFSATQAARDLKSAQQGVVDANKAVIRSEQELARAQEGLSRARKEAAKDLIENRRAVRDAVWAEEDAVDRLRRAQENLAKAQRGTGKSAAILSKETDDFTGKVYEVARISSDATDESSNLKDAQRELIRAQEDLVRSAERTADAKKHQREEDAKGVEGSDKVRDATRRLEDAQTSLSRAHDNVAASMERVNRVMEDNARRAAGGAAANNALNAAMSKLTPTGRDFVKFLHGEFMPAWQTVINSAQDGLLPGVKAGLQDIMRVMPDMAKEAGLYAKGMGDAFSELTKHMTSAGMVKDLKELGALFREVLFGSDKDKTKGLLDALIPLSNIIVDITKAAGPMTKALTNGVVRSLDKLSAWMDKPANAKKMTKFFDDSFRFLKLWGGVLKPLVGIFASVAEAAKPLGEWMLKELATWLGGINDELKKPDGLKSLKGWFEDMKPAIKETAGFIGDLVKVLFAPSGQGKEDSAFTKTMKALREDWLPAVERLLKTLGSDTETGPAFVGFLTSMTNAITTLVENPERIKDFIDDISALVQAMSDLLHDVQEFTDSSVWDVLYALLVPLPVQMASDWRKMREANMTGINEFEAYTRPRLEKTRNLMAQWMNFIPVLGPVMSKLFVWLTDWWMDIVGIFSSGDIAGAVNAKFDSLIVDVRRKWAKLINNVIDAYNKIAEKLHIPTIQYRMEAYEETGRQAGGKSTSGGQVAGTGTKSTGTRATGSGSGGTGSKPAMRQFGGDIEKGKQYIVGEKRPELLTMDRHGGGRIAAAVPREMRPIESTGGGVSAEQLDTILERVLAKAKPNVDMEVNMGDQTDPKLLASELAWSLR